MSIGRHLRALFGKPSTVSPPAPATSTPSRPRSGPRNSSLMHSVLSIDSLGFVGIGARSANKRWVVGGMDRLMGSNPRPGELDGTVVLVDYPEDRVVIVIRRLSRPIECAVSDVGVFVVNDASWGGELSGEVQVFDQAGQLLLRRRYKANVYNLDISKCGRYVVVQTANSPNIDGNLLEVLDVRAKGTLFSTSPETGWADKYGFAVDCHGELQQLTVMHEEIGRFHYAPTGQLIDREAYRKARLHQGGPELRIYAAKDALKASNGDRERLEEVLEAVTAALQDLDRERTDCRAAGLRVQGETLEALDRPTEAIAAYEDALAINPKIGLAKRAAALKKVAGSTPRS